MLEQCRFCGKGEKFLHFSIILFEKWHGWKRDDVFYGMPVCLEDSMVRWQLLYSSCNIYNFKVCRMPWNLILKGR